MPEENKPSVDPAPPPYSALEKVQTTLNRDPNQQNPQTNTAVVMRTLATAGHSAVATTERVIEVADMASKGFDVVKKVLGDTDNPVLSHMIQLADRLVDVGKSIPFIAPAFVVLKVHYFLAERRLKT